MSDEEMQIVQTEEGQVLTAEYKDGQLQIVEVSPFEKGSDGQILPDAIPGEQTKYLQVFETSKGLVHLDLLNFTIVKNESDDTSYEVVGSSTDNDGDTTVTCVLAGDNEENDNDNQDTYVMVNTEEGRDPMVFLQSTLQQIKTQQNLRKTDPNNKPLTPAEILEKAKALQKAKALLHRENSLKSRHRGRKRKSDLPPPMELLSSPNFKLYLYSCKQCNYKCNAIKEMSKHKATEHGAGKARGGGGRSAAAILQCARCPFRGNTHSQLVKHVRDVHVDKDEDDSGNEIKLDADDLSDADVLVCGACGFESGDREVFRKHIEKEHGVNLMLRASVL